MAYNPLTNQWKAYAIFTLLVESVLIGKVVGWQTNLAHQRNIYMHDVCVYIYMYVCMYVGR